MKKDVFIILSFVLFLCSCSKEDNPSGEDKKQFKELIVSGKLSEYITKVNIYEITKLTINSYISGEDWNILFEMAVLGNLEILDMSNAQINGVEGIECWNDDEIPEYAFSDSKKLKEVFLPKNTMVIGREAFSNCKKLTTIHFPDNIDSIAARAFYKSGLSGEFNVPKQLRVVGKQAFGCTDIDRVVINSDVRAAKDSTMYALYGNSVFADCDKLTEVVVKEGCTILELGFSHCTSLTKVSLPSTLRRIGYTSGYTGNYIFHLCKNLATITLPKNLRFIGYDAFSHTALKYIEIPDNVQYIWTYAFHNCDLLEKVILPNALIKIGQGGFEGCKMLGNIVIPEKVSEIGCSAFMNCTSLQSISFKGNVSAIENKAFMNCTSLKTVILPNGLESLGSSAFEGCNSLSKIVISDSLKEIETTTFKDCVDLQDVTLGESIETIRSSCFLHSPKLSKLTMPITVKYIENYAFSYTGLKDLTVMWTSPIVINNNVFYGVNLSKSTLKVPLGTETLYKDTSGWQKFGTIEEVKSGKIQIL